MAAEAAAEALVLHALERIDLGPAAASRLGLDVGSLRLVRAVPRRAGALLLEFRDASGRTVAGQWHTDPTELEHVARATARVAAQRLGGRRPVATIGHGPERVVLQAQGADRKLAALAPLAAGPTARLLAHRPERRATVRVEHPDGPVYAKVLSPSRARSVATATRLAARVAGPVFAVPALLEHRSEPGVLLSAPLPGRSLHEHLGDPEVPLEAARRAGRALRAFHASAAPRQLPRHGAAEEAQVLRSWISHVRRWLPELAGVVAATFEDVVDRLAATAPERLSPLHRDLHDKQLMLDHDGPVGLLDLDTLAAGDPALDLANLLVHLELRALQGICDRRSATAVRDALLDGYAPDTPLQRRLDTYADSTRLRLACLYSLRPPQRGAAGPLAALVGAQVAHARQPRAMLAAPLAQA